MIRISPKFLLSFCAGLIAFAVEQPVSYESGAWSIKAPELIASANARRSREAVSGRRRTSRSRSYSSSGGTHTSCPLGGKGCSSNLKRKFDPAFTQCTQQLGLGSCSFGHMGINSHRSKRGNRRKISCHSGGHAMDLSKLVCGGKTYRAIKDSKIFMNLAKCLSGKSLYVCYADKKSRVKIGCLPGHHCDHIHVSAGSSQCGERVAHGRSQQVVAWNTGGNRGRMFASVDAQGPSFQNISPDETENFLAETYPWFYEVLIPTEEEHGEA